MLNSAIFFVVEGRGCPFWSSFNVLLGSFCAQYDIENTSTWSLGSQRIFLRKSSYLRTLPFHTLHPIKFDMKIKFFLRFAGKSTLFAGKSQKKLILIFLINLPANRVYLPANRVFFPLKKRNIIFVKETMFLPGARSEWKNSKSPV